MIFNFFFFAMNENMLLTSVYENMAWLSHMVEDWMGLGYFEESLSYVLPPLMLLLLLFLLTFYIHLSVFFICSVGTFFLYVWKKTSTLHGNTSNKLWNKPRQIISQLLDLYGKIWHDYEVIGMEHLPEGPGLIIYYHGAMPLDYILFIARFYRKTRRLPHSVILSILYSIPGMNLCLDVLGCIAGKRQECVEILKQGQLLGIAPGGLKETCLSDENYDLVWGSRSGFAQVALEAKVPIIPMFTQNSREVYRVIGNTKLTKWLYENYSIPFLPLLGGIPVKLRTYFGEPIPYDSNITAKELAEKTKVAIENLRDRHQKRPGNILRALSERFGKKQKDA